MLSRKKSARPSPSASGSSQPDVSSQKTDLSPSARSWVTTFWVACSSWPRRGRMMKIGMVAGAELGIMPGMPSLSLCTILGCLG